MSNPNKPTDDTLNNLYRQRKASINAPVSIKKQILMQQQTRLNGQQIWRRIGNVAVAASTLLLFGLVFWHHYSWQQAKPTLASQQYTIIELHSLAPTQQSAAISERYAKHYQAYLSQQQILAFHHKKQAVLRQIEGDWQLQTCDQQLVQVSQQLIQALTNIHQIETSLKVGDSVDVMFDKTGIILGIKPSKNYLHC